MQEIVINDAMGQAVKVTQEELESIILGSQRVTEITVSSSRRLNTDNFQGEDFHTSMKLNFEWFWNRVPTTSLADPAQSKLIQKVFANAALRSIGAALRSIYVNHLVCVGQRAQQLKLPWYKALEAEMAQLDSPNTFDPMGIVPQKEGS